MKAIMRCVAVAALLFSLTVTNPPIVRAQYTANFQTNIISGVTSNWSGDYNIDRIGDVLLIQSGGILVDGEGRLSGNSNNFVLVTDSGSVWSNDHLYAGFAHDSLVISNGGQVINSTFCVVGDGIPPAMVGSNSVLVTGTGSVLSNGGDLVIGGYFAANRVVVENGGQLIDNNATFGFTSFAASNNSTFVKGSGSIWINHGGVFFNGIGSSLVISNGGQVTDSYGYMGYRFRSSNTSVLVTGAGSVWSNQQDLYVGNFGSSNTLVISRGGLVNNVNCYVGYSSSSNNSIVVTDFGSVWSNASDLYVGKGGSSNSLVIADSGQVINRDAYIGFDATSSNNSVSVITKTTWRNRVLHVGEHGSGSLFMTLTGKTEASNLVIGVNSATCDSLVELDSSGQLFVTNATHDAVLEVRHGQLIFNSGTLQADILVMTNSCASLVHTGGTLIVGSVILDLNAFRITSVTPQGNDVRVTWLMGPGQTNALQATAGDASGGYNTNGFADIFVVTNNTTAGTPTNYLDVGGATNVPARYYRVRLVP